MIEADKEYLKRKKKIVFDIKFNMSNIFALYGKINDLYVFILIAFKN